MSRTLAIDFGRKKIGLALSDETGIAIQNLPVMNFVSVNFWMDFFTLIRDSKIETIVIGNPLQLDSQASILEAEITQFKKHIEKEFPNINIDMWDERFTTQIAEQTMQSLLHVSNSKSNKKIRQKSNSKKQKMKKQKTEDSMSAHILLRSYLDSI